VSLVLEGTLSDVGLADLLRLVARESRSGCLRVTLDGSTYRFALRAGRVVAATCGDGAEPCPVEDSILALVRHRRGAFRLEPARPEEPVSDEPGVHAEALAERGDMELVRLAERMVPLGGEEGHPRRDRFPSSKQMDALDAHARALYALVNGERTLVELIVRSRLDPLVALDALDQLMTESLVKVASAAEVRRPRMAVPSGPLRDWIAAALPASLLLAWLALSGPVSAPQPVGPFEIRPDPLSAARAAHELELLRAAVEAHRFAEGRWPEQLGALVERGYVPGTALTDLRGRPYYYAVRDDEFVLLAPER